MNDYYPVVEDYVHSPEFEALGNTLYVILRQQILDTLANTDYSIRQMGIVLPNLLEQIFSNVHSEVIAEFTEMLKRVPEGKLSNDLVFANAAHELSKRAGPGFPLNLKELAYVPPED